MEGTVVTTGGRFGKIFMVLVKIDQMGNFGKAAGFEKLSTKKHTIKNLRNNQ